MQISPVVVVRAESARFRHPLLLLHGLWAGSWIWQGFTAYLAHRGWESWVPDFPDHASPDRVLQVQEICRDLPAPPVIIGHDAGAVVAAQAAQLVAAPAVIAIAPLLARVDGAARGGPYTWPQFWPTRWLGVGVAPPRGSIAGPYLEDTAGRLRPDSGALFRALAGGTLRFPNAPLPPGLVVCGSQDPITPPSSGERLVRRFDWSLHVHPTRSHFPMLHPGWETLADELHRWMVRTLGERVLAWLDDESGDG